MKKTYIYVIHYRHCLPTSLLSPSLVSLLTNRTLANSNTNALLEEG